MTEMVRALVDSVAITALLMLPFAAVAVFDWARGRHQVPERRRPLARLRAQEDEIGGGRTEKE